MPPHRHKDRRSNDPNFDTYTNDAVKDIANGVYTSYRKASAATGISKSTLANRAKNRHQSWQHASAQRQLLTPDQEDVLISWADHRALMGKPYSPADLRAQASEILGKPVGRNWHRKFERRHPNLQAAKPIRLDPKRAKNFNEAIINDYFNKLEELHARYPGGIPPQHIWNMDEKGVQMGGGRKKSGKKFYFLKAQRQRYRISSDNLELVTILECMSAAGDIVPPSFCLQHGSTPDLRQLKDDEYGSVYFSESGWTDSFNCERWLEEVFIPYAKGCRTDSSKPIVLVMDGHDTHETLDLQRVVYKHLDEEDLEIIIFCFPSKCTHKLQPLDVAVFASVERSWQEVCSQSVEKHTPINRFTIIPAYIKGTRQAITKDLIQKAFRKSSLYPVDRSVFQPTDFAPSMASSSVAHVPDSFPPEMPSSDPYEPSDSCEPSDLESNQDSSEDEEIEVDSGSDTESEGLDTSRKGSDDETSEQDNTLTSSGRETPNTSRQSTEPVSSLMASLANVESSFTHMTRSATAELNLFVVPPPSAITLEEDYRKSETELFDEVRSLRKQLSYTHQALLHGLSQLNAANAHCTSIRRELSEVRKQLDNATKKKERGSKKIKARFLTAASLRAEFDKQDAEQQERNQAAAEKGRQKEADNAERARRVADDSQNRHFNGRMTSYRKDDLRALALALSISDTGTNDDLSSRIRDHFEAHPSLKDNARFAGLFNRTRSQRAGAPLTQLETPTELEHFRPIPHPAIPTIVPSSSSDPSHPIIQPFISTRSFNLHNHPNQHYPQYQPPQLPPSQPYYNFQNSGYFPNQQR